jgi:hypothetical protein
MSRSLTEPPFLSTERVDDPWPKPLLPLDAWQFRWEKFETGQHRHHSQHKLEVFLASQTVLLSVLHCHFLWKPKWHAALFVQTWDGLPTSDLLSLATEATEWLTNHKQ